MILGDIRQVFDFIIKLATEENSRLRGCSFSLHHWTNYLQY